MTTEVRAYARRLLVLVSLAMVGHQAVQAEVVTYLGRSLTLHLPAGYCPLGSGESDQERLSLQRQMTVNAGELAQFGVWCADLAEMHKGNLERPTRWVQILVLKKQGVLLPVSVSRTAFVSSLTNTMSKRPPDMKELEQKANQHLANKGIDMSMSQPQMMGLGEIDGASFIALQTTYRQGDYSVPIMAYGGITLANSLPLGIYAYTSTARALETLDVARAYVRRVHADNP